MLVYVHLMSLSQFLNEFLHIFYGRRDISVTLTLV